MKALTTIIVILALTVAACTAPPEDVPRAEPVDDTPEEVPEEMPEADHEDHEDDMEDEHEEMDDESPEMPDEDEMGAETTEVPINIEASSFTFIGYGPGKEHPGTFEDMEGVLIYEGDTIVGARGTIQAASVKSDSTGLDEHLKNEDFFHVDVYPEITIVATEVTATEVTGEITFHGETATLTFPATVTENSISAETVISMADFGIEYTGVNDEVLIEFMMTA